MLKLFRPTRLRMTMSATALALVTGAAAMMLTAEPAYACSPGGGGFGQVIGIIDWLLGRR